MASGGGGVGGNPSAARAGLVAATPELLAKVAALPPLRGDPDIDLAEAIADDGRSSLSRLLERFRWPLVLVGIFVTIDAGTTLVGPLLIRHGIDRGVELHHKRVLVEMCIAFLAVQLVSWGNQIVELLHTSRTAERMLFTLRARTFAHLQRLSLDYYDKEMGGRIMTRMTTDVEALAQLLQQGLLLALTSIVSCVGVVGHPVRARCASRARRIVRVAGTGGAVTVWFQRVSRRSYLRARDAISTVNAELQESLAGVRVTQSLGREDNNAARFAARSEHYRDARLRSMQLMSIYFASSQLLSTIAKALTLWYGAHLIGQGTLTSGLLIAFLLYLDQFFTPLQQLSAVFDQWIQPECRSGVSTNCWPRPRRRPKWPTPPIPVTSSARCSCGRCASPTRQMRPRRCAASTSRSLPANPLPSSAPPAPASRRSSSWSRASTTRPVVGCSSTASTCATSTCTRYRRHIGYVPQEPFLFSGTIRSNIAYGRPDATDVEIERAARAVGAHDLVASMPDGYLTLVAEAGRSLSAGQRQLLCLARAQLIDPSILILDEATSNLDLATEAEVQRAMNLASKGRTTLLIAHRLQTARNASRIVVVDDGQIIEDGSHDELVAAGGHYAALWDAFDQATALEH